MMKPHKEKAIDTHQHLLNTGKCIMACKGFSAVGLSEILKTAQVPKGSFYHYFDSKESFGEALLSQYFSDYLNELTHLLNQENTSATDRLMNYWMHWKETQVNNDPTNKCLVVKLAAEVCDLSESMRTTLQQGTQKVIDKLAICIQEGIDQKEFHATANAQHAAMALYQLWLGASLLAKSTRDPYPFEVALEATCQTLEMLGAAPSICSSF